LVGDVLATAGEIVFAREAHGHFNTFDSARREETESG
jgi:hypothetical protein